MKKSKEEIEKLAEEKYGKNSAHPMFKEFIEGYITCQESKKSKESKSAEEVLTAHYMEKFTYNPDCTKSHQEFKQIALDAMQEYASQFQGKFTEEDMKQAIKLLTYLRDNVEERALYEKIKDYLKSLNQKP